MKRESDTWYTVNVGAATFQDAVNMSLSKASKDYKLYSYNCTHYALDVFNAVLPTGSQNLFIISKCAFFLAMITVI